jgi:polysaccharide deacetylase family protein (PEP-CTERM system associated)
MSTIVEAPPEVTGVDNDIKDLEQTGLYCFPFPVAPFVEVGRKVPLSVSRWNYFRRKYFLERMLGCVLLILAAPLIAVLWCIVRLHSKGGGFFRQTRVGFRGKPFEIIKLRTMVTDAEADGKARWCVKGDPRITSLGRILRKTHLDELPQLINVAKGEMTLVGPRPERPCFVTSLKKEIAGYERRLSVLPGITGLAQINLPPDETIEDVRRKQYLDLMYIQQTSLGLDLRMLLATSIRLLGIPGELVISILRLGREIPPSVETTVSHNGRDVTISDSADSKISKNSASIIRPSGYDSQSTELPTIKPLPNYLPNALTIDVEDYFHVTGFADRVSPKDWDSFPSRVEANTDRLLELFRERNVRGTFFILGWVADRYPKLIQRIANEGHEIGCHSYWHRLIYQMSPEEFRDDLIKSKVVIEQAAQKNVCFFRAPSFSITKSSLWAIDILVENGFTVDSSIFPMKHDRYGIPDSPTSIHRHAGNKTAILEFPPSVWRTRLMNVPVGGGYFRLAPQWLTQRAIDGVRRDGTPAMLYIHPWEIDPQQPRIQGVRFLNHCRHSVGLSTTFPKLESLLKKNRFATMSEVLNHVL